MPMLSKKKVEELRKQRLFRVIDTKDGHNGYMYKVGLNEDPNEFSTSGGCVRGGLYFTTPSSLLAFWKYGDRVAEVEIPEGEPVFEVSNAGPLKYRAKRIIISALYKKGDIIDELARLGMDTADWNGNLTDDILRGVIDKKYLNTRNLHVSKILATTVSREMRVELLRQHRTNGGSLEYSISYINSKNIPDIIEAGYKIPGSYVVDEMERCFYTAPKECKYLLDHCDGGFQRYKIENWIKYGHVAIIRELAKRGMIPDNMTVHFEDYVSKDRRSEIRKLCAK